MNLFASPSLKAVAAGLVLLALLSLEATAVVQPECVPGLVTCCFTFDQVFVQMYVNNIEVTSLVQPTTGYADRNVAKTVTFREPSDTAVIAFKGRYFQESRQPSMMIKCTSTRPESPWNNIRSIRQQWRSVYSNSMDFDQFPAGWYTNTYSGTTYQAINSTSTNFILNTTACGTVNQKDKIRAQSTRKYFTFRQSIVQPVPCGTDSPTMAPTPPTTPAVIVTTSPTTGRPSAAPTRSPTCARPSYVDVVWVMDGSSSSLDWVSGITTSKFNTSRNFVAKFAELTTFSPSKTRMGFVEYAGELWRNGRYSGYTTINETILINSPAAVNQTMFLDLLAKIEPSGGTTNTSGALDWVRINYFRPDNYREGSHRIVILVTDGYPTSADGVQRPAEVTKAEQAAQRLKDEDDVFFVFVRIGNDYPNNFFLNQADMIYQTQWASVTGLLTERFLCLELPSFRPTASPTNRPTTLEPSRSPTTSPTTTRPSASPTNRPTTLSPTVKTPSPTPMPTTLAPTTRAPSRSPTVRGGGCETPNRTVDIMWILDESGSMSDSEYTSQKRGVTNWTTVMVPTMSQTTTRMTYTEFAAQVGEHNDFSKKSSREKPAFISAINGLTQARGGTYTWLALRHARQNLVPSTRPGVPKVLIIVSDGMPTITWWGDSGDPATINEIRQLQALGVRVILVRVISYPIEPETFSNRPMNETYLDWLVDQGVNTQFNEIDLKLREVNTFCW